MEDRIRSWHLCCPAALKEIKEFRFGVHQPFPARQKVYAKVHFILLSPNIFLQIVEKNLYLTTNNSLFDRTIITEYCT